MGYVGATLIWLILTAVLVLVIAAIARHAERVATMTPQELADHEAELARFFHRQ